MKKTLIIIFTLLCSVSFGQNIPMRSGSPFLMSGNVFLATEAEAVVPISSQIIADHNAVAAFDNIPQEWINEVKKMQLGYIGESHSVGVRTGLVNLEEADETYQVELDFRAAAYTDSYLRAFSGFNYNGDIGNLGEYEWYKNATARAYMKAGITYTNETLGTPISVLGLGWCWDPDETAEDMSDYINATKEYIQYCIDKDYSTKVIFTTGPVDEKNASGETGWNKHLAYEVIRDSVYADSTRILFDFADILCYNNDGSGPNTYTWDGHTYPIITTESLGNGTYAHMGPVSGIRLAKAMWWMLARIAGWDGEIE